MSKDRKIDDSELAEISGASGLTELSDGSVGDVDSGDPSLQTTAGDGGGSANASGWIGTDGSTPPDGDDSPIGSDW